jgi:hypothetical protein
MKGVAWSWGLKLNEVKLARKERVDEKRICTVIDEMV